MSRKRGKPAGGAQQQPFKGFVNLSLTAERKREYAEWAATDEDVSTLLGELIDDDHRVSFSSCNDGNAVQASVTCRDKRNGNAGWCMTSRAPTWYDALRVALWKHYVVCSRDWEDFKGEQERDDWG